MISTAGGRSPTAQIIALAIRMLGDEEQVRDLLQALPREYADWRTGRREAPGRRLERLVDALVTLQAQRVIRQRAQHDRLKSQAGSLPGRDPTKK